MTAEAGDGAADEPAPLLRAAAAGLVGGLLAAFAMNRFQSLVGSPPSARDGETPATVRAADMISCALTGRAIPAAYKPLAGRVVHYALGAGLGVVYGVAAEYRPAITKGRGAAFGLSAAALLDEAAVPAVGLGPAPWKTDVGTHLYSLASHLVFGAVAEVTRSALTSRNVTGGQPLATRDIAWIRTARSWSARGPAAR